eukprot:jgi/Mesvir1/20915/Mv07987-RA.1
MAAHDGHLPAELTSQACRVILVRHGETEYNRDGRLQGQMDIPLNTLGLQQAALAGERLSLEKIAAVYSSDLDRAMATAVIIASHLEPQGMQPIPVVGLRERHLGDLQGMTLHDARKNHPRALACLLSHDRQQSLKGVGGESLAELYERATSTVGEIAARHLGETIVCVSHGGTLNQLYRRACGEEYPGKIVNAAINNIFVLPDGTWRAGVWSDTAHLHDTGWLKNRFGDDAKASDVEPPAAEQPSAA